MVPNPVFNALCPQGLRSVIRRLYEYIYKGPCFHAVTRLLETGTEGEMHPCEGLNSLKMHLFHHSRSCAYPLYKGAGNGDAYQSLGNWNGLEAHMSPLPGSHYEHKRPLRFQDLCPEDYTYSCSSWLLRRYPPQPSLRYSQTSGESKGVIGYIMTRAPILRGATFIWSPSSRRDRACDSFYKRIPKASRGKPLTGQ